MISTRRAIRTGAALGSACMIAAVAAGCSVAGAQSDPPMAPSAPATSMPANSVPASSAPETETETSPTGSTTGATPYSTQNGTASFLLPEGWSADDVSAQRLNHNGEAQWHNTIEIADDEGRPVLMYGDGPYDDASMPGDVTVVAELAVTDDLSATAWMIDNGERVTLHAELADMTGEAPSAPVSAVEGRNAIFRVDLSQIDGCAEVVADAAAGQACLESEAVVELLDVISTVELHDVPWDAMPEGS